MIGGRLEGKTAVYLSHGIRANAVCPGTVDSPSRRERIAELSEAFGSREEAEKVFLSRQPTGRLGTAGEVAYLSGEDAAVITGQTVNVDGGITI
jgi:2-keto-3-deoxy-L-fuconate dehydrogenase